MYIYPVETSLNKHASLQAQADHWGFGSPGFNVFWIRPNNVTEGPLMGNLLKIDHIHPDVESLHNCDMKENTSTPSQINYSTSGDNIPPGSYFQHILER